jgi:ankyrin repeat protein
MEIKPGSGRVAHVSHVSHVTHGAKVAAGKEDKVGEKKVKDLAEPLKQELLLWELEQEGGAWDAVTTTMANDRLERQRRETERALESMRGRGALGELMTACYQRDATEAARALDKGADVDGVDGYGENALRLAARQDAPEVMTLLLGQGAKIDERGWDGETALMRAVSARSLACVEALLKARARVDIRSWDASDGDPDRTIRVWSSDEPDAWGPCAVMCAEREAEGGDQALAMSAQGYGERLAIARALIDAGAEVDDANRHGLTPLLIAASKGSVEMALVFIEAGADANRVDHAGRSVRQLCEQAGAEPMFAEILRGCAEREARMISEATDCGKKEDISKRRL